MENKVERLAVSEYGIEHKRYATLAPQLEQFGKNQAAYRKYAGTMCREYTDTLTHAGKTYDKFFKYIATNGPLEDYRLCCHPISQMFSDSLVKTLSITQAAQAAERSSENDEIALNQWSAVTEIAEAAKDIIDIATDGAASNKINETTSKINNIISGVASTVIETRDQFLPPMVVKAINFMDSLASVERKVWAIMEVIERIRSIRRAAEEAEERRRRKEEEKARIETERARIEAEKEAEKEDIQSAANVSYNQGVVFPPNPKFIKSYNFWHEHQSVEWSSHETRPEMDREKFLSADETFREICLSMVTCLMHGDSVVLDTLRQEDVFGTITAREVNVFFMSQIGREDKHQDVYSRMLDVADEATSRRFRSYDTKMALLEEFYNFAEYYSGKIQDLATQLYFVMLCECVMFAPMFQTICYMAYADYAPILGNANAQVMRDEAIHYKHARALLADLRVKIPKWLARKLLFEFIGIIERLLVRVVGTYETQDGLFSLEVCLQHFYHVCYGFMSENDLFVHEDEERRCAAAFGSSPAELYMNLPKYEIKSNLMESVSTIYAIESDFEKERLDVSSGWD